MRDEDLTPVWQTVGGLLAAPDLNAVIQKLREGLAIALPTETVYGIAVDALNVPALHRLMELKGRGSEKRFAIQAASLEDVTPYLEMPLAPAAERLIARFCRGPMTLLLRAKPGLPDLIGGSVVGLRIPDHPTALQVLRAFGGPLAVTSANISGKPAAVSLEGVLQQLGGRLDGAVDGGQCSYQVASTVVDLSNGPVRIVREGVVPTADILAICQDENQIR